MSSKALLLSSRRPRRLYECCQKKRQGKKSIEVWTTTCIVTRFGKSTAGAASDGTEESSTTSSPNCTVLVNPSNPQLAGCRNFSYFPRGGPVPSKKRGGVGSMHRDWQPLGFVSNWGGMEVGSGMMYPAGVVDGLVHQLGGRRLRAECAYKKLAAAGRGEDDPCPVGTAVVTTWGDAALLQEYDKIVHATPPFYRYHDGPDCDREAALERCYRSVFTILDDMTKGETEDGQQQQQQLRVAVPLLGSGARGFPYEVAVRVASKASVEWCSGDDDDDDANKSNDDGGIHDDDRNFGNNTTIAFGVLEEEIAEQLVRSIENEVAAAKGVLR